MLCVTASFGFPRISLRLIVRTKCSSNQLFTLLLFLYKSREEIDNKRLYILDTLFAVLGGLSFKNAAAQVSDQQKRL